MPDGVRGCLGRRMGLLRPRPGTDPRFLLYAYLGPKFQEEIRRRAIHGATVDRIPINEVGEWPITVSDLEEQRAIAGVLGALDDKIDANTRLTRLCETLAITHLQVLSARRRQVSTFATLARDQVKPVQFADREVDHFSLPAFDARQLPDRCLGQTIKSSKFVLSAPSVLVSKLNPHIPRIWYAVPSLDVTALASTEFVVLEPTDCWSPCLLWAACAMPSFSSALRQHVTGTTGSHQRVRPQDVMDAPIMDLAEVPPDVRGLIDALVRRAAVARRESEKLVHLRDALLPPLMSGEVRVRDAESAVAEAT